MSITRRIATSAVALALGVSAVGVVPAIVGPAVAGAQPGGGPGHPGGPGGPGGPGAPGHPGGPGGPGGPGPGRWNAPPPPPPGQAWRGIDQGRFDHQPFNYRGAWVTPIFRPDVRSWGFWFLGLWIPL